MTSEQIFDSNTCRPEHHQRAMVSPFQGFSALIFRAIQSNYTSPSTFRQPVSAPAGLAFANASRATPLVSPINAESSDLSPIPSPWLRPTPDYMSIPTQPAIPFIPQKRPSNALADGNISNSSLPYNLPLSGVPPGSSTAANTRFATAVVAGQTITSGNRAQKRHKNSTTPPSSNISEIGDGNPPANSSNSESMPPPPSVQRQTRTAQNEPSQTLTGIETATPSSIMGLDMRNPPRQTRSQNGVLPKTPTQQTQHRPTEARTSAPKTNAISHQTSTSTSTRTTAQRKQAPQTTAQPPKKHTHKDAEQKRRDSLKNSFDELRDLLPPIPLALEDPRFAENPPLPGSLPPRGPPKGDAGPNRHVSKLHLLRCGNDFIRQLKGRVERRDLEIEKLRSEIIRLRGLVGDNTLMNGCEEIDTEKDLDAEEESRLGIGGGELMSSVMEEGEDENDS